jgi:DNA polymerase-3 subunit epsilon
MNLILYKPAVVFDIESTGTDPVKDEIIELAIIRIDTNNIFPEERYRKFVYRFNPGMHIPEEATKVHGIIDEDVKSEPHFEDKAEEIKKIFSGCDVIGYSSNTFDVPMLVEKMLRLDIEIFNEQTEFIDVAVIFKKKEERTLSAAVKFFLDKEHDGAHSALADVEATLEVLNAQVKRYPDIGNSVDSLSKFSQYDDRKIVDYAGKLVYNKDGKVCYNIGKAKGVPVEDDPGFGEWMLSKDFALDTKRKIIKILQESSQDDFVSDEENES